jgi:hypothetical protein
MEIRFSEKYKKTIIKYSKSNIFEQAIKEWKLIEETTTDEYNDDYPLKKFNGDDCICGHKIYHMYIIKNEETNKYLANGSDCIHKLNDDAELKKDVENYIKIKKKVNKVVGGNLNTRFEKSLEKLIDNHYDKVMKEFVKAKIELEYFTNSIKTKKVEFGKFKNKKYSEIPKYYIQWYGNKRQQDSKFYKNKTMDNLYKLLMNKEIESDSDIEDIMKK